MKVLIVSEPGLDGVFRYVETLCLFLLEQGVSVHLAYSDRRSGDRLGQLVSAVADRGGRTLNLRTANGPALSDWTALRSLRRLAAEVRPDIVHSHSSKAGALSRMLPFLGIRSPQLYTPHAYWGMRPGGGGWNLFFNAVEGVLGRIGHTMVVSRGERDFALGRLAIPSRRLFLIANGVDTELFAPPSPEQKRESRRALGLPETGAVLGCMGRSSEQKDPITLYQAFARAAAGERRVSLLHVGHGKLDQALVQLTQTLGMGEKVHRKPSLPNPLDFYWAVDGFILTSRYEGLSLAALEALSCNLPLILSDAPGNRDLLDLPLSHAQGVNPGDIDGFAHAITAWLDQAEHPTPVNHRDVANAHYHLPERLEQVLNLYAELIRPPVPSLLRRGFPPP